MNRALKYIYYCTCAYNLHIGKIELFDIPKIRYIFRNLEIKKKKVIFDREVISFESQIMPIYCIDLSNVGIPISSKFMEVYAFCFIIIGVM